MRERGSLPPAEELLMVAIDERSLARFGRFPWPRSLMAEMLVKLGQASPKVIALDVLYSEATNAQEDEALAAAIARAGNVVVAAQLTESFNERREPQSVWLRPLPAIERAAAGTGHAHVAAGFDGVARAVNLRQADDEAQPLWALAVETLRVGAGLPREAVRAASDAVWIGSRRVPLDVDAHTLVIGGAVETTLSPARLTLDYIGPPGSFAAQTVSFADVLDGRVSAERVRDKYVLIGATAADLGDRLATPFTRTADAQGRQHGEWTPGVEILAHALQTILHERFYRETPDELAALGAALTASAVLLLLSLVQGRHEALRQTAALAGLLAALLGGSYFVFAQWLWLPPLVPMLVACVVAAPLALLRRALEVSVTLDARIAELGEAPPAAPRPNPLRLIARLTEASAVRLLTPAGKEVARYGSPGFTLGANETVLPLRDGAQLRLTGAPLPAHETLLLCRMLAHGYLQAPDEQTPEARLSRPRWWPRGSAWQARTLSALQRRHTARARFVERALQSAADGLLMAAADGCIVFANPRAAQMLNVPETALAGSDLFARLAAAGLAQSRDVLVCLLIEGAPVERELVIDARYYRLRLTALEDETGLPGFVAALTEITQQRALQQTQSEVMALVTHEMKTPLTSIQGLSEVLARHEFAPEQRRELHAAINDEAKRLARMIDEYLDLTRLASGARPLRCAPLAVVPLLERVLLLLEPVAAKRGMRLLRRLSPDLPPVQADADLLARAVTNLVANALKFSPPDREVVIEARLDGTALRLDVTDQGCGIPAEALPHVFEKFYRVPRVPTDEAETGAGLGLAFVRECAEQHGGRVTVTSEEGVGSTFTLWLPLNASQSRFQAE